METQKLKLLILEDNETDALLIQRVLLRSGLNFEAIVANDECSFLEAIQQNTFDVILSDNYLPQFDATGAIALMRENKINTPLILVTGTVSENFALSMIKTGACDYILKDRLQRLPSAVLGAVERHVLKTRQKQELDALVQGEAAMRAIFDNTDTGYALLDDKLNIVLFNRPIYTFSVKQLALPLEPGKYLPDFFQPERRPVVSAMLQSALNGAGQKYEAALRQDLGPDKVYFISSFPVAAGDQKPTRIVLSVTDITNRKILDF